MRSLLGIVCCFFLTGVAWGQTDRGTITGTVSDPTGALVANAPIQVKSVQTGTVYTGASSATGNFTFAQLPPGTYELTVTVPGFKNFIRQNIVVQVTQTVRIDVLLEVGAATESVTVSAETSLLKTESGDVSVNVTGDRMLNLGMLPIGNGFSSSHGVRNPMAVANLTPGTFFDPNLNIRVNGAPSNTESVRIEGQDSTNGVVTFAQSETQPSVDAIQELSVQTSNYAAEYGQAGAGVFNYTMRSGTNQFHGSLYDYNSNEAYNAGQAYTHTRPKLRRNDYGGTIGGPVWIPKVYDGRDKTFFFFGYEAFREKNTITTQFPTVPTEAYRKGDFRTALTNRVVSGTRTDPNGLLAMDGQIFDPSSESIATDGRRVRLPFAGNQLPQNSKYLDPSAQKVLALIPHPNVGGPDQLVNNYNNPFPTDRKTPIPSLKIDHSITSKAKISGYWSSTETAVQYCQPLCGSQGLPLPIEPTRGTFIESHTERINFDYTLTPTMLLHLGVGYQHNDFKDTSPVTDFDVFGQLGIKGATRGPKDGARFPQFSTFVGNNSTGGMNQMGPGAQSRSIEIKPTFVASISWVKDNHTFKFGGEGRTEGYPTIGFTNNSGTIAINAAQTANPWFSDANVPLSGGSTGFPFASFLMGRVNTLTLSAPTDSRGGRKFLDVFAQDTWKVTRKLTLDYGLRWDYFGYSREQYGRTPDFSPTVANAVAGGHPGGSIFEGDGPGHCGCSFGQNYYLALGPRLGVAYQVNPKTVIRIGFGVTYSSTSGGGQGAAGATQTVDAPGFGDAAILLSGGYTQGVGGSLVSISWPDLRPDLFPTPGTFSGAPGVTDNNAGRPARQMQWSIGVQREIMRDLVVDVSYVANRGNWWRTSALNAYNSLTPEFLKQQYGLDIYNAADRTILGAQIGQAAAGPFRNKIPFAGFPTNFTVQRALTPFPQFGPLSSPGPLGKTWYDSLQTKLTKRFSHGLDLSYSFTWSKELNLGVENDGGLLVGQSVNDLFNRDTNKQLSSFSRPLWNILAFTYTVPQWGPNKWMKYALSDWTLGTTLQYGSGQPIAVPGTAGNLTNLSQSLGRGTRAERIPGVPLFLADLNCHCFDPAQTQVLNPAAWRDPGSTYDSTGKQTSYNGTFSPSAAYYNDYRYRRIPRETLAFGRLFRITEHANFQIRMEFTNPFNRSQVPNPVAIGYTTKISTKFADDGLKVDNAGFGAIATLPGNAVAGERTGLLVGRLTF
jgi:carboxypeptidase family protein/TonB-dependent receptor-like protein